MPEQTPSALRSGNLVSGDNEQEGKGSQVPGEGSEPSVTVCLLPPRCCALLLAEVAVGAQVQLIGVRTRGHRYHPRVPFRVSVRIFGVILSLRPCVQPRHQFLDAFDRFFTCSKTVDSQFSSVPFGLGYSQNR